MFYLDTNAAITLAKDHVNLSESLRAKSYVSLLTIQELLKSIDKIADNPKELRKRITTLKWIESEGLQFFWSSLTERTAEAFQLVLRDPRTTGIKRLYNALLNYQELELPEVIRAHSDVTSENNAFFEEQNSQMTDFLNNVSSTSDFLQNHSPDERKAFLGLWESLEPFQQIQRETEFRMYDALIQSQFAMITILLELSPEDAQKHFRSYNGTLDVFTWCQIRFSHDHTIGKSIRKNDISDMYHTAYLQSRSCKLVTNDRTLQKLVRKTMGSDRYAISVEDYLRK